MIFIAIFALSAQAQTLDAAGWRGTVVRVVDGDSVWVKPLDGGRVQKIRIVGIDAPESCQDGGQAARTALDRMVYRRIVTVDRKAIDDYGRTLAALTLNDASQTDVARSMVQQGWAWSYRWHHDLGPYFADEEQARSAKRGIFAQTGDLELPRDFRLRHGPCH